MKTLDNVTNIAPRKAKRNVLKVKVPILTPAQGINEDEIARKAYELYESRGCVDGFAEQDWFQAQRIISSQIETMK